VSPAAEGRRCHKLASWHLPERDKDLQAADDVDINSRRSRRPTLRKVIGDECSGQDETAREGVEELTSCWQVGLAAWSGLV
jgi:hypothetical protein